MRLIEGSEVIGFAGNDRQSGRDSLGSVGEACLVKSGDYSILLYHNPAVAGFHKPQDALGVWFHDEVLYLGLADGCSVVNRVMNNDSGWLAHEVVKRIPELDEKNQSEVLEELRSELDQSDRVAATTVIWGEIRTEKDITSLDLFMIGSPGDMGRLLYLHNGRIEQLRNKSRGFFPYEHTADRYRKKLVSPWSLVFTSDGIRLGDDFVRELVNRLDSGENPDDDAADTMAKSIAEHAQHTRDDESVIIVCG